MKILHIVKTEPDDNTKTLMAVFGAFESDKATIFKLFNEQADYEKLIDLIFKHDKAISWW